VIGVLAFVVVFLAAVAIVRSYTVAVDGAVVVILIALVAAAIVLARRLPVRDRR
jgi:hypothetical protein